jgi:hypothetical protein
MSLLTDEVPIPGVLTLSVMPGSVRSLRDSF